MTVRERFHNVINFQPPGDRLPMIEWAAWWDKTTDRWKTEGMPEMEFTESLQFFGLDEMYTERAYLIWKPLPKRDDGKNAVVDEADYDRIRDCLLQDGAIEHMCQNLMKLKERHDRGEILIRIWLDGFFWFPRALFGIEPHMYAFYDEPALMHRMNNDLAEYHIKTMNACLKILKPDMVGYAEDMSYNHGPMLSKALFDEFLLPYYQRVNPVIKAAGVPILVDSDGDITQMVPWLCEAGIEGVFPLERQAGVDINYIREQYPRFIMMGGFDKMCMNQGEEAIRREFERILPVMRSGGYIPSVDHQTPPGVSYEDYQIYIRLFKAYCEKAAVQ